MQMEFDDQLNALVYYHLEEHESGTHLVQVLQDDTFAREHIAPKDGIKKGSFFEAINSRGLEQLMVVFNEAMSLPDFMAGIEEWMRSKEDAATEITEVFLKMDNTQDFPILQSSSTPIKPFRTKSDKLTL